MVLGSIGEARIVLDTLAFTETVVNTIDHKANIFQTLTLTDKVLLNSNRLQDIVQTLHLSDSDYKLSLPLNVGDNQAIITRPVAVISKSKLELVTLIGQKSGIVLPLPQYGDTEARQSSVTIKRTMSNKIHSYIKINPRSLLNWTFDISRPKANALKAFVDNNIGSLIYIYDWQGRIFVSYLNNNPLTFTTQGRYVRELESVEVVLEFQGVKLHG